MKMKVDDTCLTYFLSNRGEPRVHNSCYVHLPYNEWFERLHELKWYKMDDRKMLEWNVNGIMLFSKSLILFLLSLDVYLGGLFKKFVESFLKVKVEFLHLQSVNISLEYVFSWGDFTWN